MINLEGKTCSRFPEKFPKTINGAVGAFINDQVVICEWGDCYTLKKGGTTWTLLGNLNSMDHSSSSVVVDNILYVIGGSGNWNDDHCATIESISLDGTTTLESITVNGNLQYYGSEPDPDSLGFDPASCYGISDPASVTINSTTSITMGGNHGGFYLERTWYYNGTTFSEGPDLINGRIRGHAAGLLIDKDTNEEYIAVVGGLDQNWMDSNFLELLKIGDNKWKTGILFIS